LSPKKGKSTAGPLSIPSLIYPHNNLQAKNKKLEIVSSTLASRYDQLVHEYESTKKMLLGFEDENQLLLDQLRVI
jgi:hypothetical protein